VVRFFLQILAVLARGPYLQDGVDRLQLVVPPQDERIHICAFAQLDHAAVHLIRAVRQQESLERVQRHVDRLHLRRDEPRLVHDRHDLQRQRAPASREVERVA
jgi:hypothetical protein